MSATPGKINILVINISLFNGTVGATRVLNLLLPLLSQNLVEVENLGFTETSEKDKINHSGVQLGIKYLQIGYRSALNLIQVFTFYFKGLKFIWNNKKTRRKNVLYVFDYPDIKNIIFILFGKLLRYKIVFDIEEDNRFHSTFQSWAGKFRNKTSLFFIRNIGFMAHAIIVISKHLEARMQVLARNRCRVVHIPISVDLKHFPGTNYHTNGTELKIFYGGSFAEKDGLEYLLKAFDKICEQYYNVKLILTGKPVFTADFEKLSPYIKNNNRIEYKGFLKATDYYHTLNSADIFCMTRINSKYANAGFPFKLGEFLATGKAVIATEVGDVPEYIVDKENALLIKPDSVNDIVTAISYFLSNKEKISSMGIKARKTAEQYFDTIVVSNKLYHLIEKL